MTPEFHGSIAVAVGIDGYRHGIPPLRTAVNDATRLAEVLEQAHGYDVHLLVEDVTRARLEAFFLETLPGEVQAGDRVILYFGGHGIALDGEDGPAGYLIPQDAWPEDRSSFLPMADLHAWLVALPCRHLLAILDCCFAGAFRWASTRDARPLPAVIHRERYDRFIRDPAWQVLTSAAFDQQALDVLGQRGERGQHSPFALALFEALAGAGDVVPRDEGDGVITATELYLYLRDSVEVQSEEQARRRQTPGLWLLNKHDKGEYIFLVPGHELNLPPAPELTSDNNPYRGLKSYDERHHQLFFGREEEIEVLAERVAQQPFTAVLGASGTGKSSLVKAGLVSRLRSAGDAWVILPPLRPTATPLAALRNLLAQRLGAVEVKGYLSNLDTDPGALAGLVAAWQQAHPDRRLLLVIDQFEELVTLCRSDRERGQFLHLLARALEAPAGETLPSAFRLVLTLRTDFEPAFSEDSPLAAHWPPARYVVPPLDHDDLRDVIEGPASVRVLHFEPYELVDELITEVIQTPGALPLLSFTLSELYDMYLRRQARARQEGETLDRSLTEDDYRALGGVVGSLRTRATEEYERLPDEAYRQTMRRIMLRMVAVEGGELARRRVPRSELVYLDEAENRRVDEILGRLDAARLVVRGREEGGEPYVEPAHGALVRAWDKLLLWKQAAEEYLPLQRRVAQAAQEWDHAADEKARTGLLWNNNPRLPQLQEELAPAAGPLSGPGHLLFRARQTLWPSLAVSGSDSWLNRLEIEFVQASILRRAHVLQRIVAIALVVFLALSALAVVARIQRDSAVESEEQALHSEATALASKATAVSEANQRATAEANERDARILADEKRLEAERQARISRAGQLSLQAQEAIGQRPQRSLLLALEAIDATRGHGEPTIADAEQALRDALANTGGWGLAGHENSIVSIAISPDGHWLATGSHDDTARLWDLTAGDPNATSIILADHESYLLEVSISPDSRWLVTTSADGTARLWDLTASDVAAASLVIGGQEESIKAVAFHPDSRWLATGSEGGAVHLWPLAAEDSRSDPMIVTERESRVRDLAFSGDGHWLVSAGQGGVLHLWEVPALLVADGAEAADGILPVVLTTRDSGAAMIISPDSRWLVASDSLGSASLWDLSAGEMIADATVLVGHEMAIGAMAISADSRWLATAGWDGMVRLWDLAAGDPGAKAAALTGHEGDVQAVAFSPDGHWLVTGGGDATARLWDMSVLTREGVHSADPHVASSVLTGHDDLITSLAISADSRWLITASRDTTARLWSLSGRGMKAQPTTLPVSGEEADQIVVGAGGRWLVTGRGGSTLDYWDLGMDGDIGDPVTLAGFEARVEMMAASAGNRRLVTAHEDGAVNLWDLASAAQGLEPASLTGDGTAARAVALSPGSRWLAIAGAARIGLWDLAEPALDTEPDLILAHEGPVDAMAFSPGAGWLVAAETGGTAYLFDLSEPLVPPTTLTAPEHLGSHLAVSADGRRLVSVLGDAFGDDTILRWDLAGTSQEPEVFLLRGLPASTDLALSPDARWLVQVHIDSSTTLWDLTAVNPTVPYARQAGTALTWVLAISADSRWLALNSGGAVNLWDLSAPEPSDGAMVLGTADPIVKASTIKTIAFSPDAASLAAGSEDGAVRAWLLQLDGLVDLACRTAGRNLSKDEWNQFFSGEVYRATCPGIWIGAEEALAQADGLAGMGDVGGASAAYEQAVGLVLEGNSAALSNEVCWHGSLHRFAEVVLPACEHAVALHSEDGRYRDSRGLARVMLGDRQGALEDFEFYLAQLKSGKWLDTEYRQQLREAWIEALRAGQDPFDEDTLAVLRGEL
jgi:WD40 repeat protein